MNIKFKALASLAVVSVSVLILGSCTADADSSGLEYMPDMYQAPASEEYIDKTPIDSTTIIEVPVIEMEVMSEETMEED